MSTHNICFYEEIMKIVPYHQILTFSVLLHTVPYSSAFVAYVD